MNIDNFDSFFPHLTSRNLKKGSFIYEEGQGPSGIYYINHGLVGLYHLAENGKETFLRVFGKNNLLGHRSYFCKEKYHASSQAITNAEITFIPQEDLEIYLGQNPNSLRQILAQVASDLGRSELRMSGRHDKSAGGRIIESIVFLKLHYPDQLWTRKQIADYSGSTFETVTRVLNKLEKDGDIIKNGRDFSIISVESLLEKAGQY